MAEIRDNYERIVSLGREEMELIARGDADQLGPALQRREETISQFLADDATRRETDFMDKLLQIQDMNTSLRHAARALHQSLKDELIKLRSENKRMSGYRNGALVTPLAKRVISRKG